LKIVNAMFGTELGGLEQVFVDYGEVLHARGYEIINLVAPRAKIIPSLKRLGLSYWEIPNFNQFDLLAMTRIRWRLKALQPDVVIAQGNRAIQLVRPAAKKLAPFIAVNHSTNIHRTIGSDFVIAINDDLRSRLVEAGQPADRVFQLFNMVRQPSPLPAPTALKSPPVIAVMGRFVAKKGFEVFIQALAHLRDQGVPFRAILAGSGELDRSLKAAAVELGLGEVLHFPGWITNKAMFFSQTDIFCFTSVQDVCPLVLLEAFSYAKPVVMTDCRGPREISEDGVDSLLFPVDDAVALAERIKSVIADPALAHSLASAAQRKILDNYTFERAGARLEMIVREAVERWR